MLADKTDFTRIYTNDMCILNTLGKLSMRGQSDNNKWKYYKQGY